MDDHRTVRAIDFDVQFARGTDRQWTLFPHLGDTEAVTDEAYVFTFGRTGHRVEVFRRELAVLSRRERDVRLPPETFEPRVHGEAPVAVSEHASDG